MSEGELTNPPKKSGVYSVSDASEDAPTDHILSADWVPELTSVELTTLPLSERDVFVLSFVNGRRSLGSIAALAGLDEAEQNALVQRFIQLEAVFPPVADRDSHRNVS